MDVIKEDFYDNDNCKYAKLKDKYEVKETVRERLINENNLVETK